MTDIRAITIRQPWAWAIAHGGKTIENRSQGTKHRGTLLIHAGAAWSDRGGTDPRVLDAWRTAGHPVWSAGAVTDTDAPTTVRLRHLVPGQAVIAVAQLVDVHPDADCCRPWGESTYLEAKGRTRTVVHHLVLEDVAPLDEPVPCRGALGLWRPPSDVLEAVLA